MRIRRLSAACLPINPLHTNPMLTFAQRIWITKKAVCAHRGAAYRLYLCKDGRAVNGFFYQAGQISRCIKGISLSMNLPLLWNISPNSSVFLAQNVPEFWHDYFDIVCCIGLNLKIK